jgi:type III secretion protein T
MAEAEEILTALLQQYIMTGIAFALGYIRIIAVLQIFPLFTTINVRGSIRSVLALVLALPLIPIIEPQLRELVDPSLFDIAIIAFKEFIFGILIGCLVAIPFWGIQSAGDIVDVSRGASAANVADPVNANENSLTGLVLLYASLAIFVVAGGLQLVIELIYETYYILEVTAVIPPLGMETVVSIGQLLTKMFVLGVIVSGPMMIALIVIDISLVFASRIAKQIQVTDFAAIIKNLCVCAFIPLYAVFLEQYMLNDWRDLMIFIRDFLRVDAYGG